MSNALPAHWNYLLALLLPALIATTPALAKSCSVDRHSLNDAEVAEQREDYGRALRLYRDLAKSEPSSLKWSGRAILMEIRQNHVDTAWEQAQALLARSPADAETLLTFANASLRRGDVNLALGTIQRALAADPCNARVIAFLGDLQGLQGYRAARNHAFLITHQLAPNDLVLQRKWAESLLGSERAAAYTSLLSLPSITDDEKRSYQWLSTLAALSGASQCSVIPPAKPLEVPFYTLDTTFVHETEAPAITVALNGHAVDIELGNATDGVMLLTRALATSLHLPHDSPNYLPPYPNALPVYATHLDHIRIGDLEYRNCPAIVIDENLSVREHGTIPVSLFQDFAITLDFGKRHLRLDTLPEPESATTTNWSKAVIGGSEVPSINAGNWPPGAPAVPREKRDWMHAYTEAGSVYVPTSIGPDTERLFLLDYMTGPLHVLASIAREATPVQNDPSLNARIKAALHSARYSLRSGEVILPIDTWTVSPEMFPAGTFGYTMRDIRVTIDFRDVLVKMQHSTR